MLKQIIDLFEVLDDPSADGQAVAELFSAAGSCDVKVNTFECEKGSTDFINVRIRGSNGRTAGGQSPTLGIIGRLGGLGARPSQIGFVSDGDGALAALAAGLKIAVMHSRGDVLEGDVVVSTHICPHAPTIEHKPVPFMGAPVEISDMNSCEVTPDMEAILSIDTTKGNYVINHRGFAVSPTVKSGYILKLSDDILNIMMRTTGKLPSVFALSQQDITPYGNGLYHLNTILQPSTATEAPVIGVAITTETAVAGCATGATHFMDVEETARFAVEVAKDYGRGLCSFYDEEEYSRIIKLYGDMNRFRTKGVEIQ